MRRLATFAIWSFALAGGAFGQNVPMFDRDERDQVLAFWRAPGRYSVTPPSEAVRGGPWQVRLTREGSEWLWRYDRARGLGKTAPNRLPAPRNPREAQWDRWIDSRVAWDRYQAALVAWESNAEALGGAPSAAPPIAPLRPEPMPEDLRALMQGEPPAFANAVTPLEHTVRFSDTEIIRFSDNVTMRERYQYYRFPQGVMSAGTPLGKMPKAEIDRLMRAAKISDRDRRVMAAVSLLEGGFDSVNTYDTGFVSVGFIQFACLAAGAGSLGQVLLDLKRSDPRAFNVDFRRFGIDVTGDGRLVALNLNDAQETVGPAAAQQIIDDKRLIAVFQRAGRRDPFRVAQLRVASRMYHPSDRTVTFLHGGLPMTVRVGDLVRSEAGVATLMDRLVNTGTLDALGTVLTDLAAVHGLEFLARPDDFERQIVAAVAFRRDFLADVSLAQPRLVTSGASRGAGSRTDRPRR